MLSKLPKDFFWKNYVYRYPDLMQGIGKDGGELEKHYLEYGYYEHRDYRSDIALIMVSQDRHDNLLESLNSWIDSKLIGEFIIVDYASIKPLANNIDIKNLIKNYNNIKIIRVNNKKYFNQGQAYNLAFDFISKKLVIKADADHKLVNDSWIEFLYRPAFNNSYLICDYKYCLDHGLSGFWAMPKNNFLFYREDFNSYGYDDIDLYNRLSASALDKIIFFDIEQYLQHIPHDKISKIQNYLEKETIISEEKNMTLGKITNTSIPRQKYIAKNLKKSSSIININYKLNKSVNKIYCINLINRSDRWEKLSNIESINRYYALNNNDHIKDFKLCPVGLTSYIYFHLYPNAFYTYMSHYNLWQQIINDDNNEYTLILEDDIDPESLKDLIDSNLLLEDYDFIQLSHRIRLKQQKDIERYVYDGGEAYIVNKTAAAKLIAASDNPGLLSDIIPDEQDTIVTYLKEHKYTNLINWNVYKGVTSPVDKFMGYCCESRVLGLKSYIYPIIKQNIAASLKSDLTDESMDVNKLNTNIIDSYFLQMRKEYESIDNSQN